MNEVLTKHIDQEILEEIVRAIREIPYGEVVITIHNGKVVQIETREKRRFMEGPLHKQS